tara:strand:+ start:137 stop:3016 length:2880 start_codon:yes stop_codon:yes gene_type:complete
MAFKFNNLEEYLKNRSAGKQPVGTSVNPLGAFAIKPIQQDVYRPVSYPTPLPQKPFNFDPDYQASKLASKITGPDAEGRNKASSIKGPDIEGRDKAFSLEGQAHTPKDKAFGIKGPEFSTATLGEKTEGKPHTEKMQEPLKPRAGAPEYSMQEPLKPRAGAPDYSTQEPLKPRAGAPEYSTQNPLKPAEQGPAHTTQEPIKDIVPPSFTTKEPLPSGDHTHGGPFTGTSIMHKIDQLSPSKDGALLELIVNKQYKDRKEIFGSSKGELITHMNNNESGFMHIEGTPGNMMYKMEFKQTPAGGSSIWTHTRLGGPESMGVSAPKYMDKFAMVRDATTGRLPDEINQGGNSVPAAALIPRANILSNKDLVDGLYKKVGKNKFVNLRDEAKRNNPRAPLFGESPFIQRGMQRGNGEKNPDSPGFLPSLDPVNGAIGMITSPLIDTIRVGKYLISPDGLLFMAKQFGLQLTNPRSEWKLGLHRGRIFNPLSFALQVPANALGIHIDRHYLGPFNGEGSKYEKLITDLDNEGDTLDSSKNRLVLMLDEMSTGIAGVGKTPGSKIDMLSGLMGPKSLFGIGQTRFFKHTSGVDVFFGQEVVTGEGTIMPYSPETPYAKALASGEWSEAMKGDESHLKTYSEDNKGEGHPIFAREDFDKYWGGEEGTPGYIEENIKELNSLDDIGASSKTGNVSGLFNVMSYDDIAHFRRTPKKFRDFRNQNFEPSASAMFEVDNDYNTYEGRKAFILRWAGGMPDYGATTPGMSYLTGEEDPSKGDFVRVILGREDGNVPPVQLRSYIEDMSDKLSTSYSTVGYSGNPADSYIFDKISRAWSLKITVPAFTVKELKKNFQNLDTIMRHASPTITSAQVAGGNITYITVGDLWDELPTLLTDFDYTINQEGGWDIAHGRLEGWMDGDGAAETIEHELPMLFSVTLGGKFLANDDGGIWNANGRFFKQSIIEEPATE